MSYEIPFNSSGFVTIGPFTSTDGITPYAGGNIVLIGNADEAEFVKNGSATTAPLTTANNTVSAITGCDGYYRMSYKSADTDTYGQLVCVFQDDSLYLPVRNDFQVINAATYTAKYGSGGLATADEQAGIRSDVAIVDGNVDTLITQAADTRSDIAVVDANVDTLITQAADTRSDIAALNDPTAAAIADAVWDEVLTGAAHNVVNSAGRRLRNIQEFQGYESGAVWIDTNNGTAGTTSYENGTVENPVDTIADANTIATALSLVRFAIAPGSSITLAATQSGQLFEGHGYSLALGGQNVNNTHFFDAAVSGIATAANEMEFHRCEFSAATSVQLAHFYHCGFDTTVTMTLAGDYNYIDCYSKVAGASSPTFTKTAGQAITAQFRRWSGGITITGLETGDTVSVDVISGGTVAINGSGGTVIVRGMCDVTDNSGGSVTITETSVLNRTDLTSHIDANSTQLADTRSDIAALENVSLAGVKAQVVAGLNSDTYAEPGQGAPAATTTLAAKINYLFKAWRNKSTQTATQYDLYDDAGTTVDQKATVSDDGTTATKGKIASGP